MTETEIQANQQRQTAEDSFLALADRLIAGLEATEATVARFATQRWDSASLVRPEPPPACSDMPSPPTATKPLSGGGRSALLSGIGGSSEAGSEDSSEASPEAGLEICTLEKAAVNYSAVGGQFSGATAQRIAGTDSDSPAKFTATGTSVIVHPRNPHAPTVHMNVRYLATQTEAGESRWWFGGGADITPVLPATPETTSAESAVKFHAALRQACESHQPVGDYPRFAAWCDRYFWIPHRGRPRGAGGIFFDSMGVHRKSQVQIPSWQAGLDFCLAVGEAFLSSYTEILQTASALPYGEAERQAQLRHRALYAEFNLLYDRGTRFGLEIGGNVESILSSLPPLASWK